MADKNLKHADELLSQISTGIAMLMKERPPPYAGPPLSCIEVVFTCPTGQKFEFDLIHALDVIANDLFWDDRGNWSQARTVDVRTI